MPDLYIPLCQHCGGELPARASHRAGRPRKFCSDRCRKAAYRQRHQPSYEPALDFVADLPPLPPTPAPDELLARTLLDARCIAATFARLAPVARPQFSWRCERAAVEIARAIDDYFPGV